MLYPLRITPKKSYHNQGVNLQEYPQVDKGSACRNLASPGGVSLQERGVNQKWNGGSKGAGILNKGTVTEIKVAAVKSDSLVLKKEHMALMLNRVD